MFVLGWSWVLLCPRGFHSVIQSLVFQLLSLLLATWFARNYVFAFSYSPNNVWHTTLVSGSSLYSFCSWGWLSIFLWVVTFTESWVRLNKCFPLQLHWHIFVSHDVLQLAKCTPLLSDSLFHFLYLVMVLSYHFPEIYVSVDFLDLLNVCRQSHHPCWQTCIIIIIINLYTLLYIKPSTLNSHFKKAFSADLIVCVVSDIGRHYREFFIKP